MKPQSEIICGQALKLMLYISPEETTPPPGSNSTTEG